MGPAASAYASARLFFVNLFIVRQAATCAAVSALNLDVLHWEEVKLLLFGYESRLAQLVERVTSNDEVSRSSRLMGNIFPCPFINSAG